MITHTYSRGWTNGGTSLAKTTSVSSGAETNLDESIVGSTTDELVAFNLDVSQVKGLYIVADKALTLETNDGTTPINTITLVANVPFVWVLGDAPLRDTAGALVTVDVTALYVTNATADPALLQLRCLYDPSV